MNAQKPDRHELQANGKHPAPCARFCEATAKVLEGMEPVELNPASNSVVGHTDTQLAAAITARDQRIAELENECKAWALTVGILEQDAAMFRHLNSYEDGGSVEAINNLEAVLCGPDAKCCIDGSDADRAVVDSALIALKADARAIIAAHTEKVLEGMEPVAWIRPSITDNGCIYDSTYRDNNGYVKESTRREQGFKPLYTADQLRTCIAAARVKAYAAAGASPVEPSQEWTPALSPATISTAPACLNTNDKAMWVLGWNECLNAQPPAPSEAAREYMTGYSDAKEWAKPSQALELSDDEIDALLPTITLKGLDPKQQVWLTKKDAIAFARAIIAAIKQGGQHD